MGFFIVGAIFALAGIAALGIALRGDRQSPRTVALLIAGMMATVFGLLLGGFAIASSAARPIDVNAGAAQ